jgi:hypothetical protein
VYDSVGKGPSVLLCLEAYDTVKMALVLPLIERPE